jgi:hypothetical protein
LLNFSEIHVEFKEFAGVRKLDFAFREPVRYPSAVFTAVAEYFSGSIHAVVLPLHLCPFQCVPSLAPRADFFDFLLLIPPKVRWPASG